MEHLESKIPPPQSSSSPSSHNQSKFLLRNKNKNKNKSSRSGIEDVHHIDATSLRSHYSTNSTTAGRPTVVGGSSLPQAPAGRSNNSVLVDPPTTVHLTDDDHDDGNNEGREGGNNDNSNKLIGDSLLTMDDEHEDFTEEGRYKKYGGEYSSYERTKAEDREIPSTGRGTRDTSSAAPAPAPAPPLPKANYFSFSPSRTDRYYSQSSIYNNNSSSGSRPDQARRAESGLVGDLYTVDKSSVHDNNYCLHSQQRRGRGRGLDDRRHRDVYELVSSFKKELDKISAEADAAKTLYELPSSSSRRRTIPRRYSGLNDTATSTGKKYHSSMVTPTATLAAPGTGFNGATKNCSVGTRSFVSPQGPEPYPTPPPPRPVETPSTIRPQTRQQHYGGMTSTVRSAEEQSVHLSSRSTATRKEAPAKNTAAGPKYIPDATTGAAHNRSYNDISSSNKNFSDPRDIHQNIDQLKMTIQLQDKELNELRRENQRLKMINNNYSKTPSSSSDKEKENKVAPSGSIHSYHSSSSSIKLPGQQTYSESTQKSKTTRNSAGRNRHFVDIDTSSRFEHNLDTHFEEEEVHVGHYENYGTPLYRHNNSSNNNYDDQQNMPSLFSPGTRYIAKLARHMRLDDDHFVPLSEIIDRHWDKITAASTANENENINRRSPGAYY